MSKPMSGKSNRRQFLNTTVAGSAVVAMSRTAAAEQTVTTAPTPINIGNRRELFVDNVLIEKLSGHATQRLHHPTPQEIVMLHDQPWEGSGSGYHSIFQDDKLYRMYYKAWHLDVSDKGLNSSHHPLYCCYAESADGLSWRKPNLGLYEHAGSTNNNITMASGKISSLNVDAGHPAVFKDSNPAASRDAAYKAIFRSSNPNGLLPFKSHDGLHWKPMVDSPILNRLGAFDSQNLAFWDPTIEKYRAYWRIFTAGVTTEKEWKPAGIRAIRTATSDDLIHWSKTTDLSYVDSPPEQLYTNQIKPYHRAPHLLLGFPTRYTERPWSDNLNELPELNHRKLRSAVSQRYGTATTEALFMSSRDGQRFHRWNEAFLPPGIERPDAWNYGHQYVGWHLVETASSIPGAPNELSLYASESYWTGKGSALRRYSLRLDGFVSVNGSAAGGELLTKPLVFSKPTLKLNFATSAAGSVFVELMDESRQPIRGFSKEDSHEMFGNTLERTVRWKSGENLDKLIGTSVLIKFYLKDADLYSFRFADA